MKSIVLAAAILLATIFPASSNDVFCPTLGPCPGAAEPRVCLETELYTSNPMQLRCKAEEIISAQISSGTIELNQGDIGSIGEPEKKITEKTKNYVRASVQIRLYRLMESDYAVKDALEKAAIFLEMCAEGTTKGNDCSINK